MKQAGMVKWLSLLIGILFVIGSIFTFINPLTTASALLVYVAYMLIVIGILKIVRYFMSSAFRVGSFLVSGIVDLLIGFLIINHMTTAALTFAVIIGFWVFIGGVIEVANAVDLKRADFSKWWVGLLSGILGIILGYILLTNKQFAAVYVSTVFSVYMMVLGISLISTFLEVNKLEKHL